MARESFLASGTDLVSLGKRSLIINRYLLALAVVCHGPSMAIARVSNGALAGNNLSREALALSAIRSHVHESHSFTNRYTSEAIHG